jgi:hypothetical protein
MIYEYLKHPCLLFTFLYLLLLLLLFNRLPPDITGGQGLKKIFRVFFTMNKYKKYIYYNVTFEKKLAIKQIIIQIRDQNGAVFDSLEPQHAVEGAFSGQSGPLSRFRPGSPSWDCCRRRGIRPL